MQEEENKEQRKTGYFHGQSKLTFMLGLFIGISVISTVAFFITLAMLMSDGQDNSKVAVADNGDVAGEAVVDPVADQQAADQAAINVEQVVNLDTAYSTGSENAKVTMIEFSDFECPYCSSHQETVKQILEQYPDDVILYYKHFPLSFHDNAQKAAEASECAGEQGKFWEMHDLLYAASSLSVEVFKGFAKDLGLNTGTFDSCLDDGKYAAKVAADTQEGIAAGVEGTPATYVNGMLISGAYPFESFQEIIEAEL
ncbi:DsbA family protein [Patescibacteria group bacterium]|nr:DsbA family protein [Patescibacteria group bacterium]